MCATRATTRAWIMPRRRKLIDKCPTSLASACVVFVDPKHVTFYSFCFHESQKTGPANTWQALALCLLTRSTLLLIHFVSRIVENRTGKHMASACLVFVDPPYTTPQQDQGKRFPWSCGHEKRTGKTQASACHVFVDPQHTTPQQTHGKRLPCVC